MKREELLGAMAEMAEAQSIDNDIQLEEVYSPVAIILTDPEMMDGEIIREIANISSLSDPLLSAFLLSSADIVEEFPLDRIEAIERIEELDNYESVKLEEIAELYAMLQVSLNEDLDDLGESDSYDDSFDDEGDDYGDESEGDQEAAEYQYNESEGESEEGDDEGFGEEGDEEDEEGEGLESKEVYMEMKRRSDSFNALGLLSDEEDFA